jgi:hypothetical protein
MKRRKFDIVTGHYITVNEAEDTETTDNNQEEQQHQEQNKSVQTSEEIQKIDAQVSQETKRYDAAKDSVQSTYERQKQTLDDMLNAAKNAAASAETATEYDKVQTNRDVLSVRKQIADLELKHAEDINRIELEHARNVNKIENMRLETLRKIANEGRSVLPEKYRKVLNESNIQKAKIYLNNLVGPEDRHILSGMVDFNHAFSESGLVYGRDKNGYYVICIDEEDFNRLYTVMQNTGYHRDEVIATVMPQLLDRTMIISNAI